MNADSFSLKEVSKNFTPENWKRYVIEWRERNPNPEQWIIFRPSVLFGSYEMDQFIEKLRMRSLKYHIDTTFFLSQRRTSIEIPSIHKIITFENINDLNKIDESFDIPTYNSIPFAIIEKLLS